MPIKLQLPAGQAFYNHPGFFSSNNTKTLNNDGNLYNDGIMFNVVDTDSFKFKDVTVKNNHIHCMMQTQVEVAANFGDSSQVLENVNAFFDIDDDNEYGHHVAETLDIDPDDLSEALSDALISTPDLKTTAGKSLVKYLNTASGPHLHLLITAEVDNPGVLDQAAQHELQTTGTAQVTSPSTFNNCDVKLLKFVPMKGELPAVDGQQVLNSLISAGKIDEIADDFDVDANKLKRALKADVKDFEQVPLPSAEDVNDYVQEAYEMDIEDDPDNFVDENITNKPLDQLLFAATDK